MWPAARHYAVDPMSDDAAKLTPEEQKLILGGESCQWAEWVTPENVDSHIWPRNAAIAERLWSPASIKDPTSMYERLDAVSLDLEWLGLTHRSARTLMLKRMAGSEDISALKVLADVVEPVKDYNRWDDAKGPIDFHMPLTHLIDAVYPESDAAREFSAWVQTYLQGGAKDRGLEQQIRDRLIAWRDNDSKLSPLLAKSSLLQEDVPLSQSLSLVAVAGLQALDYLDHGLPAPESWKTAQDTMIQDAKKPKAGLLLMIADPVQKLVDTSAQLTVADPAHH